MKITLLTFDKHFESPDAFELRANEVVASLGEISDLSVQFVDSKAVFKFESSDKPAEQEFYVLSWLDMGNAERVINSSVSQIEANGKTVMSVDLTFYTKRVLASILVKVDRHNDINDNAVESKEIINEDQGAQAEGEESPGQQDKELNAQPDEGPKRRRKPANRKPSSGGA